MPIFEGVCAILVWYGLDAELTAEYRKLQEFFLSEGGLERRDVTIDTTHIITKSYRSWDKQDMDIIPEWEPVFGKYNVVYWKWLHACWLARKLIPDVHFAIPASLYSSKEMESSEESFESWKLLTGWIFSNSEGKETFSYITGKDKWESVWRLGLDEFQLGCKSRMLRMFEKAQANFSFTRVPPDYYARSFEERRDLLGAATVDHLCKSVVMVNTQRHESMLDRSDRNNSKYYIIVVQYTARLNAEKVRHFLHSLNNGKIPKNKFHLRLAPEEESNRLTGFEHNALTPFDMCIPVILSDAIAKVEPGFFWFGGGEVDLKLGISRNDLLKIVKPFVVDCTY